MAARDSNPSSERMRLVREGPPSVRRNAPARIELAALALGEPSRSIFEAEVAPTGLEPVCGPYERLHRAGKERRAGELGVEPREGGVGARLLAISTHP